jgi:DNA-binding MarR family transcriptional regulator/GNAT superfamily N-acetyltransferase
MRAIDIHSKKLIQDFQVTGPQLLVLREISGSSEVSIGEIARNINLSNATVTGIVNRLESRGLVKRSRAKSDRRKVLVYKTKDADSLLKNTPSLLQEKFVSLFENLPEVERTDILTSLQKVGSMMGAQDLDASPVLVSHPPGESDVTVGEKLLDGMGESKEQIEKDDEVPSERSNKKETKNRNLIIHEIRKAGDLPEWIDVDQLAEFIYENIKPYEDTLSDTRQAVNVAIDPDRPKGAFILLAEVERKPVGALIMLRTGMEGFVPENILLMVCVHPSMRGKGAGGAIIRKGIELADGDVKLHVEYDNPAKQVYEKIGFTSKYAEMRYYK